MTPESRAFVNGELVNSKSNKTFDNLSPVSEDVIGQTTDCSTEDMDLAITAARHAFDKTDWAVNHAFRLDCLTQLRDALVNDIENIRSQVQAETGSPAGICGLQGPQCDVPISFIDTSLELLKNYKWGRDQGMANFSGLESQRLIEKEAIGVVGCITPWNVPLQINLAKIIPALSAGCSVVLKPAPDTPWSATLIGAAANKTDIPNGILNIVPSSDPQNIGEQLVCDPCVDMISFTGSTATGRTIMSHAATTIKKVFLELGGKSANIILDDADFSQALLSALAVCFHAGQGCAIQTRLLIPRHRQQEVREILINYFKMIEYGGENTDTHIMGPLISSTQRNRVLGYIEKGKAEGARILLGGGTPSHLEKGFYVEPTVFVDVTNDMTIAQEEIFGPVLCVIAYEDEQEAVQIANDSIFGLSGGVWSADEARAIRVARQLRAGTVNVNGGNFYSADAPFGGYKQSGIGREMGLEGFEEYLETKTIAIAR